MRSDRDERGERKKIQVPRHAAARPSTSWVNSSAVPGGGTGWPSVDGTTLLRRPVDGDGSSGFGQPAGVPRSLLLPIPADGSRLRPPGERRRLLRSLTDGSRPSTSRAAGSEFVRPRQLTPAHRLERPRRQTATPCSMAPRIHPSGKGSSAARPSFLPGFGTSVIIKKTP